MLLNISEQFSNHKIIRMSDTKKKAEEFFKSKPEVKEVYATQDTFVFEKKADALEHAKTLAEGDDPVVETIENDLMKEITLSDLTVPQLKEKAVELELPEAEWKSLKKDDLVKYLTEKTTIQE